MNIVDLVKGQLNTGTISKLAGMLGIEPSEAQEATNAATPSLLAALCGVASTPDGARRLDAAVDAVDTASALSSRGVETNSTVLSSLFGGSTMNGLGSALSRFTGLGGSTITSLLGSIAPMIFGVLKGQKQSLGLEAGGLAKMLTGQQQNIMSAMPAGLGNMLSGIPGLESLSGMAGRATDAVRDTTGRAAYATAGAGASAMRWALPLLAVLVLGGLIWWFVSSRSTENPAPQAAAPAPAAPVAANPTPTGDATLAAAKLVPNDAAAALTTKTNDLFKSASDTFASITDPALAEQSVSKLRDLSTGLDSIQASSSALPADARSKLADTIRTWADKLNPAMDKAMAVPGVGDKISPLATEIREKLAALTKT
jgi:hypothetical protein